MNNSAMIAADQFAALTVGVADVIVAIFVMTPYLIAIEIGSALDYVNVVDAGIENVVVMPIDRCDQFPYRYYGIGCFDLDLFCV